MKASLGMSIACTLSLSSAWVVGCSILSGLDRLSVTCGFGCDDGEVGDASEDAGGLAQDGAVSADVPMDFLDAAADGRSAGNAPEVTAAAADAGSDAAPDIGVDAGPPRRVFVSSATYQGNLGGFSGGDSKCQMLATNAGLGGTWMAWISDPSSSPSSRFTRHTADYRLLDGTIVVAGWSALASGTIAHAIDLDETGKAVTGTTEVWTGTNIDGTMAGFTCAAFTSNSAGNIGVFGLATATDVTWTFDQSQYCNIAEHLYCVEQ